MGKLLWGRSHSYGRFLVMGLACAILSAAGLTGCGREESGQRLVLSGGGITPEGGYRKFSEWAGGTTARVLVVIWSTEAADESFKYQRLRLSNYSPALVYPSVSRDDIDTQKDTFFQQLRDATGVFFTGGDQNYTLDIVDKHPDIATALLSAYNRGIVFAGTSAGTAIMSQLALTGEVKGDVDLEVGVRNGLGILQGLILDQHFLKRKRTPRLKAALRKNNYALGIGIDENAVFAVENGHVGTVIGNQKVVAINGPTQSVTELLPGDRYDILAAKKLE